MPTPTGAPSKLDDATQREASKRGFAEQQPGVANANRPGSSGNAQRRSDENESGSLESAASVVAPNDDRRPELRRSEAAQQNPHVGARGPRREVAQQNPHVGSSGSTRRSVEDDGRSSRREDCKRALVGLGWKSQIAVAATAAAIEALGDAVPLERLIAEALRRCSRPVI